MELLLKQAKLRPWCPADAPSLAKYANNPRIAENLRDGFPNPYPLEQAEQWIARAMADTDNHLLAIEVKGQAAGGIGIIPMKDVYRLTAEMGYWLGEDFWNKGIVTEAVSTLVKWTYENTGLIRIYAGIFEKNHASMRVLEKAGFIKEAIHKNAVFKNGVIMDEVIYSILKP